MEPHPSCLLPPSASSGPGWAFRALTPACPTQTWPLPRGHLGYRQSLPFPGTPSFPFHVSANLGGQSCLMVFSPVSAAQLWWRMAPADWDWDRAGDYKLSSRGSYTQIPLFRLFRLYFLESNLHFGSPLWHLTICCFFFRRKTKNTLIHILLSQTMMGSWTVQVLAGELCTVCPTSRLSCLLSVQLDFHTKSKLLIVGFTFLMNWAVFWLAHLPECGGKEVSLSWTSILGFWLHYTCYSVTNILQAPSKPEMPSLQYNVSLVICCWFLHWVFSILSKCN